LEGKPRYLLILLSIWFAVSYGAGILFKEALDSIKLVSHLVLVCQQGSIYVFVILIFVYVHLMNKLDKKYGYDEEQNYKNKISWIYKLGPILLG
jgi:putative solute:sodium symporter small subunit